MVFMSKKDVVVSVPSLPSVVVVVCLSVRPVRVVRPVVCPEVVRPALRSSSKI